MGNKVVWGLSGALLGFGLVALASVGIFAVVVAVAIVLPLVILRAPGSPWFLIGSGATVALVWMSLLLDPNAPDDAQWPVALGVAIVLAGGLILRADPSRRA